MSLRFQLALLGLAGTLLTGAAVAQDVFVYPAKGQSNEQMQKDKSECYQWAQRESGVNPSQTSAPAQQSTVGRGVARGAIGGLVIGNVAGGSGSKGAAAGALMGGIGSGVRDSRRNQSQQQAAANARSTFNRAYSLCLEGRGYSVN